MGIMDYKTGLEGQCITLVIREHKHVGRRCIPLDNRAQRFGLGAVFNA